VTLLVSIVALAALSPAAQAADEFEDWTFYVGDPHTHTGVSSDGGSADLGDCKGTCGNMATVYSDARDRGLDWIGVSDHANGSAGNPLSDEDQFRTLVGMALDANDPEGGFVTLVAAEVWVRARPGVDLGHLTVLMFGDNDDLEAIEMTDFQPTGTEKITVGECADVHTWLEGMETAFGPVVAIPHHPTAVLPMATDWTCHSSTYQPAVEVYSEHGQSLTDDASGFDPMWSGAVSTGSVHHALNPHGLALQMGFMAGSDRHDTQPGKPCQIDTVHTSHPYGGGVTIAAMETGTEFTRTSLYEAIVDRRTYASSGPVIPVVVDYSTGGAIVANMGTEIGLPDGQDLDVELRIPAEYAEYVLSVSLVSFDDNVEMTAGSDGTWTASLEDGSTPDWFYPAIEIDGDAWWGAGVCTDGGPDGVEWIWLSPSWVVDAEPDLDGDGVTWADGDCDDGDDTVFPGAEEHLADGVDQDCDGLDADQDGDGYDFDLDCDDTDPDRYPGAIEVWYDGIDQDCDDNDDDQDEDGWPVDSDCDDEDPYRSPSVAELWYDGVDQDCDDNDDDQDEDGWSWEEDCKDEDPDRHPGATEVWYDGVDQNCDGNDDDQDGDGVALDDDCDDGSADVAPGAVEVWYDGIDQDCDGNDDDQDEDGYALTVDCDDVDASVSPDAIEVWYDGVDQDCDGNDDDRDGDGWAAGLDCDDGALSVHPGAQEVWYDRIDQDCDGNDNDQDSDGFGSGVDCNDTNPGINQSATEVWYDGVDQDCDGNDSDQDGDSVGVAIDCDDSDATVFPQAEEVWYDGVDQNCDGNDDDRDNDSYAYGFDCDDDNAGAFPGAIEVWYDGVDQNCDGNDNDQDGDGIAFDVDCDDSDASVAFNGPCDGEQRIEPDPPATALCASAAGGRANAVWLLVAAMAGVRRRRRSVPRAA
jgi:Putative metal-binding motif